MFPMKIIFAVLVVFVGWGMAWREERPEWPAKEKKVDIVRLPVSYLALGDSYTIGESVSADERYPSQVKKLLVENEKVVCEEPTVIAKTGWTTANLLQAMGQPARNYDIVSLLIGVNNQFQGRSEAEYAEQFELLLQRCIRLTGNRPGRVIVLSIPDYSVTPFGRMGDTASIAAEIDSFNRINLKLARNYSVQYINVTEESRKAAADPSLIAPDGLHFSAKEYLVWARMMEPLLKGMLP